jgi:bifunctional non-homologous end joining protein LigD
MRHPDIAPMLATLGRPPAQYADFAVEAKYDGQRGMAVVDRGQVMLLSRNGADITLTFPEITAALPCVVAGRRTVLDGEIVALDETGVPSFERLQRRWPQNRRPSAELLRQVPVQFFAFDVLRSQGQDVTHEPYAQRRQHLLELTAECTTTSVMRAPGSFTDVDPAAVLESAAELNLEGIVCKHLDSPYMPGQRSRDWIKTPLRQRGEFVVGGWLPGIGANRHNVAAVLVGAHNAEGRLQFCGVVGAGMSARESRRLTAVLPKLARATSPFKSLPKDVARWALWATPVLVGDVEYREFNRGALRHPSWKGLRIDIAADTVALSDPTSRQEPE